MSSSQRKRKSEVLSQAKTQKDHDEMQNLSIDELSNKCVRFLLTKMHDNIPIKRTDIIQHVFHERPGKNFDVVIKKATDILKEVYGLDLEIIDSDRSTKKYFVTNCLPFAHLIPRDEDENIKSVLTFLILTHIFMSKNNSTEGELWQFLKEFAIEPESQMEDIGSIKVFITQNLVKQNYIIIEDARNELENEEPKKYYKWGARAEEAVSKIDILKFVSEIYGTSDIKFWSEQYKDASQQFSGTENNS